MLNSAVNCDHPGSVVAVGKWVVAIEGKRDHYPAHGGEVAEGLRCLAHGVEDRCRGHRARLRSSSIVRRSSAA